VVLLNVFNLNSLYAISISFLLLAGIVFYRLPRFFLRVSSLSFS
jgi:hypothetical protein